jgi:hypothetical protein
MADPFGPPSPPEVAQARQLVNKINEEKGFLSEEDLDEIGPRGHELRRKIEEALLRKDEIIGAGVLTYVLTTSSCTLTSEERGDTNRDHGYTSLAKNLYTSNARFVFELLQNADDNHFTKAAARGEVPYISFKVSIDKVVIECNEDGFTEEHLRAICAVGQSTKIGAQGYTGEKGIGFKSVFMAAWRVHIESNAFSFSFTHRRGDSGIGMISPVWVEQDAALDSSFTRMTLFLDQYDAPKVKKQKTKELMSQFEQLQGTVLLFLRKLREVRISFCGTSGNVTSKITHSLHGTQTVKITRMSSKGEEPKTIKVDKYHLTKHIATDVPASENRSYSAEESNRDANTEIVLAFPLTKDLKPIVEDQDVFAFLPMRPMGFKVGFAIRRFWHEVNMRLTKELAVYYSYRLRDGSKSPGYRHHFPSESRPSPRNRRLFY